MLFNDRKKGIDWMEKKSGKSGKRERDWQPWAKQPCRQYA
jgi:hypothetical protein